MTLPKHPSALALLLLAAAAPAGKKPPERYRLLGFELSGSKHIDGDALVATLPQHEGDLITQDEIQADTQRMQAALTARHVHFSELTTAILEQEGPGHHIWVVWDIQHIDALSSVPYQGWFHVRGQSFTGNQRLTAAQLQAATALQPGDRIREGGISDARTGIEQAYDPVFPGQAVGISGKVKIKPDHTLFIEWMITEPRKE